jgi:hypothetical protein
MKNLKDLTQDEYKKLKKADMLTILYPEATGDYENDTRIGFKDWCRQAAKEFYPEPKVGDWIFVSDEKHIVRITKDIWHEKGIVSIETVSGNEYDYILYTTSNSWRHATPSEIESHLIEEAQRRGFKNGVKFKSLYDNSVINTMVGDEFHFKKEGFLVNDASWKDVYNIHDGWAEIIKDEAIKVGEYNVEFETNGIKVGCKNIDLYDLRRLKSFYMLVEQIGLSGIMMSPGNKHIVVIEKGGKSFDVDIDVLEKIIGKFDA